MKDVLKRFVPTGVTFFRSVRTGWRRSWGRRALRAALRECHGEVRLVIGASGVYESGWIPTDIEVLNLLTPEAWCSLLNPDSIDRMVAEHVWEHLTETEGKTAAATCWTFLKPGGTIRVAVPDGLNPDPAFINYVRPGGTGVGADDHKVLYIYSSLAAVFQKVGFEVFTLEYFDEAGVFHHRDWDPGEGMITRSLRFDDRNWEGKPRFTSIIIDARKPLV